MKMYDVIIIGSGVAALTVAKRLCNHKNVIIFTKSEKTASNSYLAQGGVAVAIDPADDWHEHYQDTLVAGAFHNEPQLTKQLTEGAPQYIAQLIAEGMPFDKDADGKLSLAREGGHLKRRILHAEGDATGKVLTTFLLKQIEKQIDIVEHEMVFDLIMKDSQCIGVKTKASDGRLNHYFSSATIIATGGCGQIYQYTSNAETVTGDGIAMAFRAGATVSDMEFVQFHPTVLYQAGKTIGLVSEAVRGEGAFLQNSKGERFMDGVHELKDLAPRDIVARAIYQELQSGELIFLNISNVEDFEHRFPSIYQLCVKNGIDPTTKLLPVIPGAHFMIGGIKTDASGKTSLKGLYAIGEAACTGVHGANRIASNSLLEGIVFGNLTAAALCYSNQELPIATLEAGDSAFHRGQIKLPTKQEIKQYMSQYAGVIRCESGLTILKDWLENYDFFDIATDALSTEELEIVNMLTVSWLITTSALHRKESIGSHFRSDFPWRSGGVIRKEITRNFFQEQIIMDKELSI
ncbi:L-aspartate oxidase [Perspicuibacillus lycopersici]